MKKEKYVIHFLDDEAVVRLQIAIVEQAANCRVGGSFLQVAKAKL